jgi:CDP-paratose 2-epimerase
MTTSLKDPRADFETNALGSLNVLEAVRQRRPESLVLYSSTNKVYGDLAWARYEEQATRYNAVDFPLGFPESTRIDFHSPYGCSKGSADMYMRDYARMYGLRTVVFRHSSMYGGRQFSTYDQGWVGWFCQQAIETKNGTLKEPFTISGNGKQVRDLLHAEDMVRLYFAAVEHIDAAQGKAFNVGGGPENSLSLLELFEFLEREIDVKLTWRQLPPRESDQLVFVADVRQAQQLLRWHPRVNSEQGLRSMIDWVTGNA